MPRKKDRDTNNLLPLIVIGAFILTLATAGLTWWYSRQPKETPEAIQTPEEPTKRIPVQSPPVIEYRDEESPGEEPDEATAEVQELIDQRKEDLGVEESIDLVLKSDESLKIGGAVVSMKEILDHIQLKRGDIIEDDIKQQALEEIDAEANGKAAGVYGIHVVKPGDNIWDIHFRFLKDYFEKRGVSLSPQSDEATTTGYSSGVGKILKFSENMVYVYNIRDHQLDVNLDLIHPLSKVIVFDMGRVLTLLDQIDYENVSRIQFDGETLWIPARQ